MEIMTWIESTMSVCVCVDRKKKFKYKQTSSNSSSEDVKRDRHLQKAWI